MGCLFDDEPWHDQFLGLESSPVPWLEMFSGISHHPEHLSDLAAFIRLHNWQSPMTMEMAAEELILMEERHRSATKEW
jgi:hypothetical protein